MKIDKDIRDVVDSMNPVSTSQRVALENTLQGKRNADTPYGLWQIREDIVDSAGSSSVPVLGNLPVVAVMTECKMPLLGWVLLGVLSIIALVEGITIAVILH